MVSTSQLRRLVGAVGIELLFNLLKSRVFTVATHCQPNQLEPNGANLRRSTEKQLPEADSQSFLDACRLRKLAVVPHFEIGG